MANAPARPFDPTDPLPLAQSLIRCASVTPNDEGALGVLAAALEPLGFVCHSLVFSADGTPTISNLYARLGTDAPHFCFAGHTDVVPAGLGWTVDPFAGEVKGDALFGRGASDMKGAIAAFAAAVARFLKTSGRPKGSISFLITGDEEGPAVNGTIKMLEWLKAAGEKIDACVVGEPTNPAKLGEAIKVGRRGSLNGRLRVLGAQGHTAYPHLADNPIPRLLKMLSLLNEKPLDQGSAQFQASTVAITTIDVGNPATNVIPAEVRAGFNVRFNDLHSGASVEKYLRGLFDSVGGAYELDIEISGESFVTPPGALSNLISDAVSSVCGIKPELSTSGGTSDARFIKNYCPVVEFGLVGQTMHKADERVTLADLEKLTRIYQAALEGFFPRC